MMRVADGKPHVCLGAETAPPAEVAEKPKPAATPEPQRKQYQKIHDEVWKFAKIEAAKMDELDAKGKSILAQVFYKKNMDMLIHSKKGID